MIRSRLRVLMACLVLVPASMLICSALQAQNPEELEKRWQKKQASTFLKAVKWERSLDAAVERARRATLPIVAYFTRSYDP